MKTPIIVYTVTHPLSTWEVSAIIVREFPRPCVVRQIREIPPDRVLFTVSVPGTTVRPAAPPGGRPFVQNRFPG